MNSPEDTVMLLGEGELASFQSSSADAEWILLVVRAPSTGRHRLELVRRITGERRLITDQYIGDPHEPGACISGDGRWYFTRGAAKGRHFKFFATTSTVYKST